MSRSDTAQGTPPPQQVCGGGGAGSSTHETLYNVRGRRMPLAAARAFVVKQLRRDVLGCNAVGMFYKVRNVQVAFTDAQEPLRCALPHGACALRAMQQDALSLGRWVDELIKWGRMPGCSFLVDCADESAFSDFFESCVDGAYECEADEWRAWDAERVGM